MNAAASEKPAEAGIDRPNPVASILLVTGRASLAVRAGTVTRAGGVEHRFDVDTPIGMPELIVGEDYGVKVGAGGQPFASLLGPENPVDAGWIAGFHYAPGGNATARAGGNAGPEINPQSLWDLGFRPACPDPRGMAHINMAKDTPIWIDIYLLGAEHKRHGTSRCGAAIADGRSLARLNYHDAVAVMAEHGKRLPTYDEFRAAAFGVTERSSVNNHPKTTGLDAARTSAIGLMQATGNLWIWGADGDLDDPGPSLFGGGWIDGSGAGSRYANLVYWPENSREGISARGACDHLSA